MYFMCFEFSFRTRSGNPGYLLGAPLVTATISGEVMQESVSGLQILSSLSSSDSASSKSFGYAVCPSEYSTSSLSPISLQFGYDTVSSCVLKLNRY